MIIVSACLLGENCRYDGNNCFNRELFEFLRDKQIIKVCPEVFCGLGIPRIPFEIVKENDNLRAITKIGEDITLKVKKGCKKCFESINSENIEYAILKSKSPTCGFEKVYDGKFSGTLTNGNGIFAEILQSYNINIYNEHNYKAILEK
jgi:uncharacterized protein YbbK (DUF523 family)